jgi:hypothetical protein
VLNRQTSAGINFSWCFSLELAEIFLKTLRTLESGGVKVATTSTATKTAPAKAVSKVTSKESEPKTAKTTKTTKATKSASPKAPTKAPTIRLSEEDKKTDTVNYIFNPNTNKYVKRGTPLGKKLVKAEQTGEEIPKTMTETERLILVIQTLVDQLGLEDSAIKISLKPISGELPRGFPVEWGGKQKTARSPDHPKQPSNAYIFYTKAVRQSVVDANPDLSNTDIVSMMAKMWKLTSEEDRTEYNQLAEEDKIRYEEEMKIFEAEHPDQARAKSSPGKPTKATAYHKYCEVNRDALKEENPDLDGKSITKLLAEQWEEVKKDEDEHAKYQALADEANEGFEERVTEYHEDNNHHKKLSDSEQAKANDPEHYELNPKTGRYISKEEPKKETTPHTSPKVVEKAKPATKPAAKSKPKPKTAKTVSESVTNSEVDMESVKAEILEVSETVSETDKTDDEVLIA